MSYMMGMLQIPVGLLLGLFSLMVQGPAIAESRLQTDCTSK